MSTSVYAPHSSNLMVSFLNILLVDADCVNPQYSSAGKLAEAEKSIPEIVGHWERRLIHGDDPIGATVSPNIGECFELLNMVEVNGAKETLDGLVFFAG